ncbi:nucleolar RNA-associated protein [Babesia gibsoni]|uniref:Nucleolar RNA-associated protein n=1 Tax=Babesia gibsoni TaxID=33632 RepID=A0AAD8LIJ8_BABGI|nr:nucleolar RNA-associated protein [Babesia gibsoni]
MAPSKRHRKHQGHKEGMRDDDSPGLTDLESILDSGIIYGRSLPIKRLKALIKDECLEFYPGKPTGETSILQQLLDNFGRYLQALKRRTISADYIKKPDFKRFFRTNFNAYWSNYEFGPPDGIQVVGSGALGFLDKSNPVLDVSIKLPSRMFNPKDHVNYRYLNKRNSWICCLYEDIVAAISKDGGCQLLIGIKDATLNVVLRYMYLKVSISVDVYVGVKRYTLCVLAHIEETLFKKVSLVPSRNNVRIPTNLPTEGKFVEPVDDSQLRPTPTYNSAILDDMLREPLNVMLMECASKYINLKGAIVLVYVWMRTQGLFPVHISGPSKPQPILINNGTYSRLPHVGKDARNTPTRGGKGRAKFNAVEQIGDSSSSFHNGISGFVIAIILCHVARCNHYPYEIEAFPLFMAAIKFIASMNTTAFDYVFGKGKPIDRKDMVERRGDVDLELPQFFIDDEMTLNVLYRVSLTFNEVVEKAKANISLASNMGSPFLYSQLFELPFNLHCHSDVKILFSASTVKSMVDIWELSDMEYLAGRIKFIFEYGMKDRLHHIYFRFNEESELLVLVGLNDALQRTTDIGPPANADESVYFREFWGMLSETRGFEDGSICECLLWSKLHNTETSVVNATHGFSIISGINLNVRILSILLQMHFKEYHLVVREKWDRSPDVNNNIKKSNMSSCIMELPIVEYNNSMATDYRTKLMNAYNKLNGILRSLEGVPLKVSNIFLCSAAFGYVDAGGNKERHRLLLDLETSAKWPKGENAVRSVKVALGIAILKELHKDYAIKSRINEDGEMELQFMGTRFSMAIICQRETQDIRNTIKNFDHNTDKRPQEEMLKKVRDYYRSLQIDRCKVEALKNPSFSSSVQLAKAFCNSCLLPDHDFICEMLNCYIYGCDEFLVPISNSGNAGFMRFLYLLAHYDWAIHPLVIQDEKAQYDRLYVNKPSWVPYLWISTPEDPFCLVPKTPCKMISKRFVGQCQHFLESIEKGFMKDVNLSRFFDLEEKGFNMVLELENIHQKLKYVTNNESIKLSAEEAAFVVETFVTTLKATYEGIIEVAYNELELRGIKRIDKPMRVYLKFNPIAAIPSRTANKQWPQLIIQDKDTSFFVLNYQAILGGIRSIGEGLMKTIRFL